MRMTAFKCDRCGKLFATRPLNNSNSFQNWKHGCVQVIRWGTEAFQINPKDLCEDCAASFILWFQEPALAAITNDEKL